MPFDKAWALGRWEDGSGVLDIWNDAAKGGEIEAQETDDIAIVLPQLTPNSLVLLSYGLDVHPRTLLELRRTGCKLLVYVPPGSRTVPPYKALEHCSEGVLGFFAGRANLPDSLKERLRKIYGDSLTTNRTIRTIGGQMFKKIELSLITGDAPVRAFLASPYRAPYGPEFLDAARAALERRGVQVVDPRDVHNGGTVGQKVDNHIRSAHFVVANLRLTDRGFNPNVWMEIGFARGLGKPLVSFRYATDAEPIASDLAGIDYLKYYDPLDLAMKLYWGLEWMQHRLE